MRKTIDSKELTEYFNYYFFTLEQDGDIALDNAIDSATNICEWIPVTEQLPDDLVDVLTCDAMGHIHIFWHHHEFTHPFNIGEHNLRYYPVTHWMPLPEQPKENAQ